MHTAGGQQPSKISHKISGFQVRFHDFKMYFLFLTKLKFCSHASISKKYPVVSGLFVKVRDFRFQDIKDFIEDFGSQPQDFKLVADPSAYGLVLIVTVHDQSHVSAYS